jgi:type VI secretion system secreted protein Hcp
MAIAHIHFDGDEIQGESKKVDHEDQIEIASFTWATSRDTHAAWGKGLTSGHGVVQGVTCTKFVDSASVYLAQACLKGTEFPKVVLYVRKDNDDPFDFVEFTMEKCAVADFQMTGGEGDSQIPESFTIVFEKFKFMTKVIDENSQAQEDEFEYDIAAGK